MALPFFPSFSQGLRAGVLVATVCSFTSTSQATLLIPVSGTSAAGRPVAFTAGLTFSGDELVILLANVSPVDSKAAADVLSSFYFDIRRGTARPPLVLKEAGGFVFRVLAGQPDQPEYYTPQTFVTEAVRASDLVTEAVRASDLVARARGDGTWLFRELDPRRAPFLGFGIGTVGNSGLAPNSFNPHIVGLGKQMIDFAIYAGTDIDPVGVLDGAHLVHREIEFRFTGAAGYGEKDVVDLYTFGMGTGPDSQIDISLPEPGGLALAGIGVLGWSLAAARRRPR